MVTASAVAAVAFVVYLATAPPATVAAVAAVVRAYWATAPPATVGRIYTPHAGATAYRARDGTRVPGAAVGGLAGYLGPIKAPSRAPPRLHRARGMVPP